MRGTAFSGSALVAVVAAVLVLLAMPAAAKKGPPTDHGFPLDEYLRGLVAGKVFVGGAPPKIVGAKTKDTIGARDGFATYQPQLGFRRAGRDNGHGTFLVLKARSWGSALAYVIRLDPGIVKLFRIAFPKAIGGKPFPPLYAKITYRFEIAPDSPSPAWVEVPVASVPHPDPALRKQGVALVTFKRGFTPGTYLVRVSAEVGLAPHPLKTLYDAYETVTGAVEWVTIALAPGEVALEKLVDKAIEKLVEKAAEGDPAAIAALSKRAFAEKVVKKKLESVVKSALTRTEVAGKIEIPTVVPALQGLKPSAAVKKLQERKLRYAVVNDSTRGCGPVGTVKSQSPKPQTKTKVGTRVRFRVCRTPTPAPVPKPPTGGGGPTWVRTAIVLNPAKDDPPAGVKTGLTSTHIDYDFVNAPQVEFDVDIDGVPPTRVAPGAPYEFGVSVAGKITGGRDTQGFRTADAILFVDGRWVGTPAHTGQNCNDPIGAEPISCTPPAKAEGVARVTFPSSPRKGDTFTFGIGLLNCGSACSVEYRYTAR